ncbi:MAG: MerR family transcriptional regulator [Clostridia bacterium]|nr:MerR family transcriptional regulator [Clostridia bacterium]
MKMKEVCALTGLSERAVRLYCEQGLLAPARTEVRGRVYLEFDETHITELRQIATLRTAGFSLDEIKTIFDEPHLIGQLLRGLRERLEREQGAQSRVLAALDEIDPAVPPADAAALCAALAPKEKARAYENGAVLRDGGMSFREFCERGIYASDSYTSLDRNVDRGRVVMEVFRVLYWLSAGLNLLVNLANGGIFGGLIVFAVQVVLYIYLFRGVTWIRIVMAVFSFFEAFFCFAMMADCWPTVRQVWATTESGVTTQQMEQTGTWIGVAIFAVIGLIYAAVVYFLGFNAWVSDYLYDRSTRN